MMGLASHGRTSPGGSCRLLPTKDGWAAVNLARRSDVESVPAIIGPPPDAEPFGGHPAEGDPWVMLEHHAARGSSAALAERCQLLGVAASVLGDRSVVASDAVHVIQLGDRATPARRPRVVDLSSMWAGPLCAHLLGRNGCEVTKVEDVHRPDGARFGNREFYDWLHEGHHTVTLDFATGQGRADLHHLLSGADVVIEASRPRALRQLGIDAEAIVADNTGTTWLSITGYGRSGDRSNWIAFGDDAGVAGGLVGTDAHGDPVFVGDAIADPLTGLFAARAALAEAAAGGGSLVEVRMAAVCRMLTDKLR